jgi:pyruvate dehydrogenase E1 component
LYRYKTAEKKNAKLRAQLLGSGAIMFEVLKAQAILEKDYGVAADVWSVTSYKELYRDGNDCARWNMLHPTQKPKVPYVTQTLQGASGPFIAASDYMKVLPESISQWIPGKLVALGTDGFGRSENRPSLRNFFEVDAKHIVLATLHALAGEKSGDRDDKDKKDGDSVSSKMLEKAIRDLGIDPEKSNPATS